MARLSMRLREVLNLYLLLFFYKQFNNRITSNFVNLQMSDPDVELAQNIGLSDKQLNEVKRFIKNRKNEIINSWVNHFNS